MDITKRDINEAVADFICIFLVGLVVVSAYQVAHSREVSHE